jgi:hypothetical protein
MPLATRTSSSIPSHCIKSVEDKGAPAQFTIPTSWRKLRHLLVSMTPVDLTLQQADGRPFSCFALRDLRVRLTLSTTSCNRVTVFGHLDRNMLQHQRRAALSTTTRRWSVLEAAATSAGRTRMTTTPPGWRQLSGVATRTQRRTTSIIGNFTRIASRPEFVNGFTWAVRTAARCTGLLICTTTLTVHAPRQLAQRRALRPRGDSRNGSRCVLCGRGDALAASGTGVAIQFRIRSCAAPLCSRLN